MKSYLNQLAQTTTNAPAEETGKLSQRERARRTKPLDQQITEFLQTIPPQLRDRPWSIMELVSRLSGKWAALPGKQGVAAELIRRNWRRERRYGPGYSGTRLWIPPTLKK